MSDLLTAYKSAVAAVRTYAKLVQEMPHDKRHTLLFLAEDVQDEQGETLDCLITGSAPQLAEVLVNAGLQTPRLACAVDGSAEHLNGVARQYAAGRPWPISSAGQSATIAPASTPNDLLAPLDLTQLLALATSHMLEHGRYGESAEFAPQLAAAWPRLPEPAQRRLQAIVAKALAFDTEQHEWAKNNPRRRMDPGYTDLGDRRTRRAWDLVQQAWEGHPLPELPTPEAVKLEALAHVLDSWQEDNVNPDAVFEPSTDAAMDFLTQLGQCGYSIVATNSLPEAAPAAAPAPGVAGEAAWVSVTERLPEPMRRPMEYADEVEQSEDCLLLLDGNDSYMIGRLFGPLEGLRTWFGRESSLAQYPTHWMPLPAAPTATPGAPAAQ